MSASKARNAVTAERRTKLIKARLEGKRFEDIWRELGYACRSAATKDFSRALEERIAEQRDSIEVHREMEILRLDGELERLGRLYGKVEAVLNRHHVTVSGGRVVIHDEQPLEDDGPVLAAVDRLLRIEENRRRVGERRAKLLGLEAPRQVEVLTIDAIDQQIGKLNEQIAALDGEAGETD